MIWSTYILVSMKILDRQKKKIPFRFGVHTKNLFSVRHILLNEY